MASEDEEIVSKINRRISIENDQIADIAKEISRKEEAAENEIENEFKPKTEEIQSNLTNEKANLDDVSKTLTEWTSRKNDLNSNIKNLENELKKILKEKESVIKTKIEEIEPLGDPIKKAAVEKEIESEFNPIIARTESQLTSEKAKLDDVIKETEEWTTRKNDINNNLKALENDLKNINKEKVSALKLKLKEIEDPSKKNTIEREIENRYEPKIIEIKSNLSSEIAQFNEASNKLAELAARKNQISQNIKTLDSDHKRVHKDKASALKMKLQKSVDDDTSQKRVAVEKELDIELKLKINEIESKLSSEKPKFDEASEKVAELTARNNELKNNVKELEIELKNISKEKISALKLKLKEYKEEKKARIKVINNKIKKLNKDLKLLESAALRGV